MLSFVGLFVPFFVMLIIWPFMVIRSIMSIPACRNMPPALFAMAIVAALLVVVIFLPPSLFLPITMLVLSERRRVAKRSCHYGNKNVLFHFFYLFKDEL